MKAATLILGRSVKTNLESSETTAALGFTCDAHDVIVARCAGAQFVVTQPLSLKQMTWSSGFKAYPLMRRSLRSLGLESIVRFNEHIFVPLITVLLLSVVYEWSDMSDHCRIGLHAEVKNADHSVDQKLLVLAFKNGCQHDIADVDHDYHCWVLTSTAVMKKHSTLRLSQIVRTSSAQKRSALPCGAFSTIRSRYRRSHSMIVAFL